MIIKKVLKSKVFISIVCILFIVSFIVFLPEIKGQYIKRVGIKIVPENDIVPLYDMAYLQTDSRWKDEHLAETDYKLEQQGCLTCVIAMNLGYYNYEVTPTDVNRNFIEASAYTNDGLLIWYKINDAYSDIEYGYEKVFNDKIIDENLKQGLLPIVKVRYKKTGIFHWVLIVGAENGEYLILDPLEQSQKPISLNIHGKVYAYRVLKKIE